MSQHRRSGFTMIEVMAAALVLGVGIVAGIGMVIYAMGLARTSIALNTGLVTAMSVAVDPTPIDQPDSHWTVSGRNATGWLNGYWVVRNETAETVQPVLPTGFAAYTVQVDVYQVSGGKPVASYSRRLIRQDTP